MVVTESGIVTEVNSLSSNAPSPMVITYTPSIEAGISTAFGPISL